MMYLFGDQWYHDLEDIFDERSEIDEYPEGITVVEGVLETQGTFTLDALLEWYMDRYEDRSSEDGDELEKVEKVLVDNIDFEKINSLMPKLYYPEGAEIHYSQEELYKMYD